MSDLDARRYVAAQLVALALAIALALRARVDLLTPAYARLLTRPWRLVTGALGTGFFVLAAPYANDPTWDGAVGLLMSVPTYLTAPWAVGALWKCLRRERPLAHGYVALCAWLASASWGYDLYNWRRLGAYPAAWGANLAASSVLYALAGLCWSLTARPGVGVTFAFLWPEWPAERASPNGRAALAAWVLVFVAGVALLGLPFVAPSLAWWGP